MNCINESFITPSDATIALQPIFDLDANGEVSFFETALRITRTSDPQFHVRLIALAEDLGFIHHIDLHVLALTIDILRRHTGMTASVNVSQRTILEDGQQYIRKLAASQVCDRLIIEITESTEIPLAWVATFAAGVREIGCRLAIDDFETGFADDILVRAVKPSLIKVVVDDTTLRVRERIIRTTLLAKEMGAAVVGERIDSEEKVELMKRLGVRYLQGYLLALPIMAQDIGELFGKSLDATIPVNDGSAPGIRLDLSQTFKPLNGNRQIRLVEKTGS